MPSGLPALFPTKITSTFSPFHTWSDAFLCRQRRLRRSDKKTPVPAIQKPPLPKGHLSGQPGGWRVSAGRSFVIPKRLPVRRSRHERRQPGALKKKLPYERVAYNLNVAFNPLQIGVFEFFELGGKQVHQFLHFVDNGIKVFVFFGFGRFFGLKKSLLGGLFFVF